MSEEQHPVRFPKVYKPLDEPHRYKIMYGGRAAARSWTVARKLLIRAANQPLRILCTRELQKSIKQSVHRLLSDQIHYLRLENIYDVQQQGIYCANGSEFMFLGLRSNPDEIRSLEGVDIVWIEEGHAVTERSWDIIDPTIRKDGSEIWITFNTRFRYDHLYQLFVANEPLDDSVILRTNFEDNPYLPEVLQRQQAALKERDYEKWLHVWGGELKQLAEGAIFGKQVTQVRKDNRRCFVPIVKNCEVLSFMDLGKNDETAIWFMQRVGAEYRFFDYFQGRLEEVEYYTRFIRSRNYLYGMHYLPHDADHQRLGMPRNIKQQFIDGGVNPVSIVPRIAHKATAIELAREKFAQCWFHAGDDEHTPVEQCDGYYKCDDENMLTRARRMEKGWEMLCSYRYKYNEDDDVYQQVPHHDRASNGADAFMQFAQSNMNVMGDNRGRDWSQAINV
ncbi:PBSX family phage terminase large subunit [bacterium]|nr:PBSX family phage terminase large subunit [bacterium]